MDARHVSCWYSRTYRQKAPTWRLKPVSPSGFKQSSPKCRDVSSVTLQSLGHIETASFIELRWALSLFSPCPVGCYIQYCTVHQNLARLRTSNLIAHRFQLRMKRLTSTSKSFTDPFWHVHRDYLRKNSILMLTILAVSFVHCFTNTHWVR